MSHRRRQATGRAAAAAAALAAALGAGGRAEAFEMTVHVGPPSVGSGGSNPITVPPVDFREYEFQFITNGGFETNIAVTPGLLLGSRDRFKDGYYVSLGGGLVVDANGTGPGVYSAFGIDKGDFVRFNFEYKQAVGFDFSSSTMLSPYSVKIGVSFAF